jgi:PIN domain nuclease of toxin-antitoxin system
MLNLDTHIVLFSLKGDLNKAERDLLESDSWAISAVVIWEIEKLARAGRINLSPSALPFRRFLREVRIVPVTTEIAQASRELDFHSDPVDELISATSVVTGYPLLTRDRRIRASTVVPLAIQ